MRRGVREGQRQLTFLAVGLSLLHVEGLVPDGHFAGSAQEALDVVGHLQGMHDLLQRRGSGVKELRTASTNSHFENLPIGHTYTFHPTALLIHTSFILTNLLSQDKQCVFFSFVLNA